MDILIGIVSGSAVAINRDGTLPGRLAQVVIADITDAQTVELPQGGEEFNPPLGCRLIIVQGGPDYKVSAAIDDGAAPVMDPGGKRIYSLDPTGMNVMAQVQLKPDGTVLVENGAASFTMDPSGNFTFHGISSTFDHPVTVNSTITATGTITAPNVVGTTNVTFGGKSGIGHKHSGVQTGSGQTGVPV